MWLDTREFWLRVDEKISDGKLDAIEINKLFEWLTEEEILQAQAIIEEKIAQTWAVHVSATENLASLNSTVNSFEWIKESLSDKEEIWRLFDVFEDYINPKLEVFTGIERENIKLIIWDHFQDLFSAQGSLGVLINIVSEKVQGSLAPLSEVQAGENGKREISEMITAWKKILSSFWEDPDTTSWVLEFLDRKLWTNINTLTEVKNKHPNLDFSKLSVIEQILAGTTDAASIQSMKTNAEISQEIKKRTETIARSFEWKAELGTQLSEMIEDLPVGWDMIKDAIGALVEKFPILGFLISMFMWEDFLGEFLSGKNKERKESFDNLIALSEKDSSPISGIFPEGFKDSFDITKLEDFFEYLESNEIDHTKEWFWEELLSGKTQNPKIKELSDTLRETHGEKILSPKDSQDSWRWLIQKFNKLPELIAQQSKVEAEAQLDKQAEEIFGKTEAVSSSNPEIHETEQTPPESTENTQEETTEEATIEEEITWPETPVDARQEVSVSPEKIEGAKKFASNSIETSINWADSLPIQIDYRGHRWELEKLWIATIESIDFHDGKLVVWNAKYNINFWEFTHESVQGTIKKLKIVWTPEIVWSNIMLTCKTEKLKSNIPFVTLWEQEQEKPLPKSKMAEVILWLLENWKHSDTIPAKWKTSEIPFDVIAA